MPNKGDPFAVETLILKNVSVAKTETGVTFISVNGSTVVFTGEFSGSSSIVRADGVGIVDANGNPFLAFEAAANAVNYVQVGNGATESTVIWSVVGDTVEGDFSFIGKRSTTANSIGGAMNWVGGAGIGTGAGGAANIIGGAGGTSASGGNANILGGSGGSTTGAGGQVRLTGGTAVAGNANGGDIVSTPGSGHGTGKTGNIMNRGLSSFKQGAFTAKTVSATLTAAELITEVITVNQGAGAACSLQLPTADELDTQLPNFVGQDSFTFSVVNISTVGAEDATLTINTGITLVGSMFVASNAATTDKSSGYFKAAKTADGAWTIIRLS